MAQEQFKINGTAIKAPDTYKPIFSTTSTGDSDRTQDLVMHNSPMGTIEGYDLTWGTLTWDEISTILNSVINRSEYSFYHKSPLVPHQWITRNFYSADYNMEAQTLKDGEEEWTGLSLSLRGINPV